MLTPGGDKTMDMAANPHTEEGRRRLLRQQQQRLLQGLTPVNTTNTAGDYGIPEGGYDAVREDIKVALTDSKDFFPADFDPPHGPHYGGEYYSYVRYIRCLDFSFLT